MDARLFDLSDRTQIEVTGRDRVKFLHSFCTNDIKKLQPGQGCEAFVTNVNGKVLGHIFVFAERDSLWIESVPGAAATLLPHFDKYVITEDVQFTDRSTDFAELLIAGPQATEFIERICPPVRELPLYGHLVIRNDSPAYPFRSIRRVDWLDSSAWTILISTPQFDAVQRTIPENGAQPATNDEFHSRRIASGFPIYGIDITEDNLAQEVGRTALAISFTKGCYLGQEPIARIDAMGHVNRQLCRLELSSGTLLADDTYVFDKPTAGAKVIGTITSTARDRLGADRFLALAYLRSAFVKPGTVVFVDGHEGRVL